MWFPASDFASSDILFLMGVCYVLFCFPFLLFSLSISLRAIAIAFVHANVVNVVVLSRIFMLFLHLCNSDDLKGHGSGAL